MSLNTREEIVRSLHEEAHLSKQRGYVDLCNLLRVAADLIVEDELKINFVLELQAEHAILARRVRRDSERTAVECKHCNGPCLLEPR